MRKWRGLLRNDSGFSLVELMAVASIIGVLATLGTGYYDKFRSNARRATAKAMLVQVYQAEVGFFTEYSQYTTNIRALGISMISKGFYYDVGFHPSSCLNYTQNNGAPPLLIDTGRSSYLYMNGDNVTADLVYPLANFTPPTPSITLCDSTPGAQRFIAGSWGNPTGRSDGGRNNRDQFTIDQNKNLRHVRVGY